MEKLCRLLKKPGFITVKETYNAFVRYNRFASQTYYSRKYPNPSHHIDVEDCPDRPQDYKFTIEDSHSKVRTFICSRLQAEELIKMLEAMRVYPHEETSDETTD